MTFIEMCTKSISELFLKIVIGDSNRMCQHFIEGTNRKIKKLWVLKFSKKSKVNGLLYGLI